MNLNKNISVWRGSDTPPTEYHLWVKDGLLYIYSDGQWKELVLTTCLNQIKDLYECKQDTLISGVNIKTINDESLLGEGNIVVKPNLDDYAKLNGDNVFTGNNSFSKALTVNNTKISESGVTLPSGAKYSHDEIKLAGGGSIQSNEIKLAGGSVIGNGYYRSYDNLILSGQTRNSFQFRVNSYTPLTIHEDYIQTNAIKGFYDSDYLILSTDRSELSLNYTRFTPNKIQLNIGKTIVLKDIVVTSDLEEVENVTATINLRLTKLEKDINTILESINNGNS